jgi:hypothetical protein
MKLILSKCFWAACKEAVINMNIWGNIVKMIRKPKIPHLYNYLLHTCGELYTTKIYIFIMIRGVNMLKQRPFCQFLSLDMNIRWIIKHQVFMDEASFTQDSINNSPNLHICYHRTPPNTTVTNFQRFSVKVQCGLYGNKLIIRPFVFDNRIVGYICILPEEWVVTSCWW